MSEEPQSDPSHDDAKPDARWWPAMLIVLAAAIMLIYAWTAHDDELQPRVLLTLLTVVLTTAAMAAWLLLFSRLPAQVRITWFGVGLVLLIAVGATVRIEQVSGDIVPIITWRWTPKHDQTLGQLDGVAAGADVVTIEQLPGASDSPQFLGPDRDGVYDGPALVRDWSTHPPRQLWRTEIGAGWSGFAVKDGRVYTQEQRGDTELVTCYELATGRPLWSHGDSTRFDTTIGGIGPRATPTVIDARVYTLGATGVLNCLDALTGAVIWRHDLKQEYDAPQIEWGFAGSPLVVDGKVVVNAGAPNGRSLMAFDALTGELAWAAGDDPASYSSPTLRTLAGVRQVIIFNHTSVTGHDIETGDVLWRTPWQDHHPKVAQPLVVGDDNDQLFYSSSYGAGATLYDFTKADDGTLTAQQVWQNLRMKAKFSNMFARNGVVYGFDDGILACVDIVTGKRRWKGGRYGHSQMILANDVLVILSEDGDVIMVETNPDEHVELTRFTAFDSKCWNTPTLTGRYLLVRNDREAALYELPVSDKDKPDATE